MLFDPSPRVFVVDDSQTIGKWMEELLRKQRCQVVVMSQPLQALKVLVHGQHSPPDVLFADLIMPQMSGLTLIRELRSRSAFRHTIMILMSRLEGPEMRLMARLAGANEYLCKPLSRQVVGEMMAKYVQVDQLPTGRWLKKNKCFIKLSFRKEKIMSKRSFYRSVLTVTVLSEEPLLEEGDLCDINTLITVGGCSGKVETTTVNEVVDGPTMATLLQEQDSDPEFLGLDEDGNDLEEEQEKEGEQNEEEDQDA